MVAQVQSLSQVISVTEACQVLDFPTQQFLSSDGFVTADRSIRIVASEGFLSWLDRGRTGVHSHSSQQ